MPLGSEMVVSGLVMSTCPFLDFELHRHKIQGACVPVYHNSDIWLEQLFVEAGTFNEMPVGRTVQGQKSMVQ